MAVDTGGGALSGALSASIIEVETGGGAVDLRSLVGNNVAVATGGGRLAVGAVYGGAVSLASGALFALRKGGGAPAPQRQPPAACALPCAALQPAWKAAPPPLGSTVAEGSSGVPGPGRE